MDTAAVTNRTLVTLTDEAALDASLVGSKAANLASLLQSGFPVPPGVVITTAVAKVSEELIAGIRAEFADSRLAVRSSATAEDLADASYAGQYETFLMVEGNDALYKAIAACRASLRSERVETYAASDEEASMAVLIQPMVAAVAAGVAFSAHPVSGDRSQVVVNAVAGLGDRLVSGEVTPDQWVVSGDSVDGKPGILDRSRLLSIVELVREVEAHFGVPQDIEWAVDSDTLWLLQARPITSLPEAIEPIPIEIEVPYGYWEHDASHSPIPNYPIESFIPSMVVEAAKRWATEFGYLFDGIEFREIGGWTYQRLAPLGGKEGPELPGWLMWVLVRTLPMVRKRLAMARHAVETDKAGVYIDRWYDTWLPELVHGVDQLKSVELADLDDTGLITQIQTAHRLCTRGIEIHALLHGSLAIILYELVTTCERLLGWDLATTLETVRGTSYKSTEPARKLSELAEIASKHPEILEAARLADNQVEDWLGSNHPAFAVQFRGYMNEFGQVALGQTVVEPTYAEMPAMLMQMIKHQVDTGFHPDSADDANAVRRQEMIEAARSRLAPDPSSLAEFERVLKRGQKAYPVREDNEFFTFSKPSAQFRYAILEAGGRLTDRGVIDSADDVFYLELTEAVDALSAVPDMTEEVRIRKGRRVWALANPGPPSYGEETPPPSDLSFLPKRTRLPMEAMLWSLDSIMAVEQSKTPQSDSDRIEGIAASGGSYTGTVRLVRDETEFYKIQAGDVLVCPITSPVWSVLFPSIGALVTDTGGVLSHPAIIAREYRIPAVVATGNATSLLADGQLVKVDGASGSVTVVPDDLTRGNHR